MNKLLPWVSLGAFFVSTLLLLVSLFVRLKTQGWANATDTYFASGILANVFANVLMIINAKGAEHESHL